MASFHQAQQQYDNQGDAEGETWTAQSEAVSERLVDLEQDPDAIERALNEIDCDHTDELMAHRVRTHLTGDSAAQLAHEVTLLSAYLLRRAQNEIADEFGERRGSTSKMFASQLARVGGAR